MDDLWRTTRQPIKNAPLAPVLKPVRAHVYARLHAVRDPVYDTSILRLGLVDEVQLDGHAVTVVCRLPALWYDSDVAVALAAEIYAQVGAVPGVWTVDVILLSEGAVGQRHMNHIWQSA